MTSCVYLPACHPSYKTAVYVTTLSLLHNFGSDLMYNYDVEVIEYSNRNSVVDHEDFVVDIFELIFQEI